MADSTRGSPTNQIAEHLCDGIFTVFVYNFFDWLCGNSLEIYRLLSHGIGTSGAGPGGKRQSTIATAALKANPMRIVGNPVGMHVYRETPVHNKIRV